MSAEIKLKIIVGIMCGITLGIPFTPIVCLMRHLFIVPFKYKKMLNKAIEQGHVVKAKLIKVKDAAGEGGHLDSSRQEGVYQYEYKNKTYKTHLVGESPIRKEITLYFERNPRRAVSKERFGGYESPIFLCYLVSVLIVSLIIIYIGVVYGFGW